MRHEVQLQGGPVGFLVGSDGSAPIEALRALYEGYPAPSGASDFTVRLEAERPWRRWVRPSVAIRGDYTLPVAAQLLLEHGLLAAEFGLNLQMALGKKRYRLLHAPPGAKAHRGCLRTGLSV